MNNSENNHTMVQSAEKRGKNERWSFGRNMDWVTCDDGVKKNILKNFVFVFIAMVIQNVGPCVCFHESKLLQYADGM